MRFVDLKLYDGGLQSLLCFSKKNEKGEGKREVWFTNFIDAVHMVDTLFMAARGLVNKLHEARFRRRRRGS